MAGVVVIVGVGCVGLEAAMTLSPMISIPMLVVFGIVWVALLVLGFRRGRRGRARIWAVIRRSALGVALLGALLGPSVAVEREDISTNVEVILAVDRTGSMAAEDVDGGPRLDAVRADILALLEATPGARYSILTWDGSARRELPLTTDTSAVASFAELLHQEISEFSSGSSLNRPLEVLRSDLESSVELRPGNTRYLVIFSDGESTAEGESEVSEDWESLRGLINGGAVVGHGTAEGGPMKIYQTGVGPTEDYIEDPTSPGSPAISRMDQDALSALAERLDVPVLLNPSVEQISELGADFMTGAQSQTSESRHNTALNYVVWPFGIAAALLIGWETIAFAYQSANWRRRHAI